MLNLIDPIDRLPLEQRGDELVARSGARYPVIDGIPVLLRGDVLATQHVVTRSYELARLPPVDPFFIDTIGEMNSAAKDTIRDRLRCDSMPDPIIRHLIGPACGRAYRGEWAVPPIPVLPMVGPGRLLDIGCNWGRWTIAAAKAGFTPTGIDPSLGALLAAKRLAAGMGIQAEFVCADARYLPFGEEVFDAVFSYSVLQHFSESDAVAAIREVRRVLTLHGRSVIQMASSAGLGSMLSRARRKFRNPRGFEVRYWSRSRLKHVFNEHIGPTVLTADCFLGLGLQACDVAGMTKLGRMAASVSELAKRMRLADYFADSIYCRSLR